MVKFTIKSDLNLGLNLELICLSSPSNTKLMQRFTYILLLLAATLIYSSCVSDSTSNTVSEKAPLAETIKKLTPQREKTPPPVEEKELLPPPAPEPKPAPVSKPIPVATPVPKPTPAPTPKPTPAPIPKPIPKPIPPSRGSMIFENRTFDYGYIEEGSVINHVFKFTNTGSVPVNILNAEVSCGCTFPTYSFLPIEPGKTGEVSARFDSTGKLGKSKSSIALLTDARPAKQELFLIGTVIPPRKDEKEEDKDKPKEKEKEKEKTNEKTTETTENKQDTSKTDSVKFAPRGPRKLPKINPPDDGEDGEGN